MCLGREVFILSCKGSAFQQDDELCGELVVNESPTENWGTGQASWLGATKSVINAVCSAPGRVAGPCLTALDR